MPSDILIIPNRNSTTAAPVMQFSGSQGNSIRLEVLTSGSLAFLGKSGSLFSISDNFSGSLMAVGDISGLPILEVFSDDRVVMGRFNSNALVVTGSNVGIGKSNPNPAARLDVSGSVFITGSLSVSQTSSFFGPVKFANNTWNLSNDNFNRLYFGTSGRTFFGAGGGYEWRSAADTTLAVLSDGGDLSIGKTTANAKLDINGNAIISGSLNITNSVTSSLPVSILGGNGLRLYNPANSQYASILMTAGNRIYINYPVDLNESLTVTGSLFVTGSISDFIGNVRDIPQNLQTAGYTLVASDNGKHIFTTASITVPASVFVTGDVVTVINSGSATLSITQGSSVLLRQAGTTNTGSRTLASHGIASITCVASNTFYVTGTGLV